MKYTKRYLWTILKIIITVYCFIMYFVNSKNYVFFLLPSTYMIMDLICKNNRKLFGKYPGITTINFIIIIRYTILPVILCHSNQLSVYANNYNYVNLAIVYMIYEMIAIFITLEFIAHKNLKTQEVNKNNDFLIIIKPSFLVFVCVAAVLLFILSSNTNLIEGFSLITKGVVENINPNDNAGSLPKILWQCLTTWLFVYAINQQKNKKTNNMNVIISTIYLLIFVLITYIGQTQISRWYSLISALAGIFTLKTLFPDKTKKIIMLCSIPLILLLVSSSIFKSGQNLESSSYWESTLNLFNSTTGDTYFAGPVSVNNAIGLSKTKKANIKNMLYDILNNMPIVNSMIDRNNATVYLYNEYIGRIYNMDSQGDQIVPLLGQSIIYFTGFFAPLLSIISILIIGYADHKFISTNNYMRYIWAFVGIWFGLEVILNMTINLSWVYIRIIPLFLTFYIINKCSSKKIIKNEGIYEGTIKNI